MTAPTWVLSNHDVVRHVTRYGDGLTNSTTGLARARAALLAMLALPGSAYLYQGEELGLPEVKSLPPEARQDPIFARSKGELPGRDGCRVPIPWSGMAEPYGFSPDGTRSWLPQPVEWTVLSAERQSSDPGSTLSFYQEALRVRRALRGTLPEEISWQEAPEDALVLNRGSLICVINCGSAPVRLPPHDRVLIGSTPVEGHLLLPDTAVWLQAPEV